ncbi:cupin domain-containing protein [Streptomyces sp. NPDC048392]|uniref:cupin domain-containing protein n=1 Tax=Streptomyces sp. NPDC048392 TaxID=3365543 RepID=UPI0037142237
MTARQAQVVREEGDDRIVSGAPEVTGRVVRESPDGRQVRGIWQMTPGVVTDTEADEVFVVLGGSATIEVAGGPTLKVGPGDLAVLREGDRTTWTVHETLRKAFAVDLGQRIPVVPAAPGVCPVKRLT